MDINVMTKWIQNGITVAGARGPGRRLNQLYYPDSIYVDDDNQIILIDEWQNDRIVKWKYGTTSGQIVAGGKGPGNRTDQLYNPSYMIVDKKNDSMIICDHGNRRIVRWPRHNGKNGQEIIFDINCLRLAIDNNEDIYFSDYEQHVVRRWRQGDTYGTIVAGGNGQGNNLNQLNIPTYIFVDEDYSVYVSDQWNHRVMKWLKGAKEGIIVAGGNGDGKNLTQLSYPEGLFVDLSGNVYVADNGNHRIMRWPKGSKEGTIILGGNGQGKESNQFYDLRDLSFDKQGSLYIVDNGNQRIQKFYVDPK
jgi:sugar lactone lactonase YvrE